MSATRATALLLLLTCALLPGPSLALDGDVVSRQPCQAAKQGYQSWLADREQEYKHEAETSQHKYGIKLRPFAALKVVLPDAAEFKTRRSSASEAPGG